MVVNMVFPTKKCLNGKKILDEVRRNPIDVSGLDSSFDIMQHTILLKEEWNKLK